MLAEVVAEMFQVDRAGTLVVEDFGQQPHLGLPLTIQQLPSQFTTEPEAMAKEVATNTQGLTMGLLMQLPTPEAVVAVVDMFSLAPGEVAMVALEVFYSSMK